MKVAILSGSVYGTAEEVARHAQNLLKAAGFETFYNSRASLADIQSFGPEAFLAVTSTTGMGELPDNLQPLYSTIRDHSNGSTSCKERSAPLMTLNWTGFMVRSSLRMLCQWCFRTF